MARRAHGESNGNVAPRHEVNGNVAPKNEVNGNVAPAGEKHRMADDDNGADGRSAARRSAETRRTFGEKRADSFRKIVGRGAATEAFRFGVKLLGERSSGRFAQQPLHSAERE